MKGTILFTAALLALTFVGRAVFETNTSQAKVEELPASTQYVNASQVAPTPTAAKFEEFGGSFIIKLTLRPKGNGWTVIKSEEMPDPKPKWDKIKAFQAGFQEPDPSTWVKLMSPVREYLYWRKQAVIHQDANQIWNRYPRLRQGANSQTGVNTLPWTMRNGMKPIDGNITPEASDRIKVKTNGEQVEVIVRGMELYLYSTK